ncbi:MAG: ABC-F family ATP-binding cassette domain-containing protein [Micropepsaceae bacterium]
MSRLQLRALSWSTPDGTPVLDRLDLTFGSERTGLVGRNGAGKSTLLKLMAGDLTPAAGAIQRDGDIRLLRQSETPDPDETVADAFGIREALERLDRLERGEGLSDDAADADWLLPERLAAALNEAGLPGLDAGRHLATLSGGQRTRLSLAALAFGPPALLLMDEPTNNLDADGRDAVAGLIARHHGGVVVASHDRELLRRMDRIVEISTLGARIYGGNWDDYAERRAGERQAAADELNDAERRVRQTARDAQAARERQARHAKPGKALREKGGTPRILLGGMKNRAEGTAGKLNRLAEKKEIEANAALDAARAEVERETAMSAALSPSGLAPGRLVLAFDGVSGGPGDGRMVIRHLSFTITGPERVAIAGPNGAGKTTLLRLATGALTPAAGRIRAPVAAAMLDQDVTLLDPALSVRDNFRRLNPEDSENTCRAALARFLFRADAALRLAGTLSGGEKLRAGLACVLGGGTVPGLVILDEPTNHLDLHAIAAVEAGINAYDGAILVVSHDPAFIEAIGVTRTITLRQDG